MPFWQVKYIFNILWEIISVTCFEHVTLELNK